MQIPRSMLVDDEQIPWTWYDGSERLWRSIGRPLRAIFTETVVRL